MEIKSEKIQIKNKLKIMWIIVAVLVFIQFSFSVIDYASYKKGQKHAITSQEIVSALSDTKIIKSDDTYKEKCESLYSYFSRKYYDMTINGVKYDYSEVRRTHAKVKESMADLMREAGYDRFSEYSIENWFKYTNFFQYFGYYSSHNILFYIVYGILLLALILTISLAVIRKKELIISENLLICKYNKKKSKEILISDIVGVESSQSGLKLNGNGFKYSISLISNADELKSEIMKRKNDLKPNEDTETETPKVGADELKKFKELLDSEVITQEEFDAKKKQLLGL